MPAVAGRARGELTLTDQERDTLTSWATDQGCPAHQRIRARIILASAEGATNFAVAKTLGIRPASVGAWRRRFFQERLGGLANRDRTRHHRTLPATALDQAILLALTTTPSPGT